MHLHFTDHHGRGGSIRGSKLHLGDLLLLPWCREAIGGQHRHIILYKLVGASTCSAKVEAAGGGETIAKDMNPETLFFGSQGCIDSVTPLTNLVLLSHAFLLVMQGAIERR